MQHQITNQSPAETFAASPEIALAKLAAHEGPILIDLDETLYLRNSTEDYLSNACPGVFALLILKALDVFKPWRWTGGETTRDVWRVRIIRILFPWTSFFWRKQVSKLASEFANRPLIDALRKHPAEAVTVVTAGFNPIVPPLLSALGLANFKLVATRLSTMVDRREGKLRLTRAALGESQIKKALLITDSKDDLDLLKQCAIPLLTAWPDASYRRALSNVYFPSQYLSLVKRPGERYILRGILQEDFAFWLLSSLALAAEPVTHIAGLSLLLLSFWTVYERGYVDNDLVAARYEENPKLSKAFHEQLVATPALQPWIWAIGAGALGTLFLQPQQWLFSFCKWSITLIATYICYKIYNRYDKSTRVWLFPLLQFARTAAFIVVVPVNLVGAAALGAHVLARWIPYQIYRFAGNGWPDLHLQLLRLAFFLFLTTLVAAATDFSIVISWPFLALLLWNLYRARQDIRAVLKAARRLELVTEQS